MGVLFCFVFFKIYLEGTVTECIYLLERQSNRDRSLPPAGSLPKRSQGAGLARASSLELHPALPCGWAKAPTLGLLMLLSKVNSQAGLETEQPGLKTALIQFLFPLKKLSFDYLHFTSETKKFQIFGSVLKS